MFQQLANKVPSQAWVAFGSVSIIGLASYPVFFANTNTRDGHDLFSSDKPEAIRESQDAKRKEYRRLIKEQRREQDAEWASIQQSQNQSQSR